VSSFDELVCQLFEDTALGELLELPSSEPVFSRDADEKLRELSQLLDRIPFDVGAKNLLRHPLWERVRAVAGLSALLVESALEGCHRGLPEAHQ